MKNIYTLENIEFDLPKNLPLPPKEIIKLIDLGNDISLVRDKLPHNLSLFNNPSIRNILHNHLCQCAEMVITHWKKKSDKYYLLSFDENLKEEERIEYEDASFTLDDYISVLRIYRCWVIRYKASPEFGLLKNIQVPIPPNVNEDIGDNDNKVEPKEEVAEKPNTQKLGEMIEKNTFLKSLINGKIDDVELDDKIRYSNHIFWIFFTELYHWVDVASREGLLENQDITPSHRLTHIKEYLLNVVIPKFESIFNRSIKSQKINNAVSNLLDFKITKQTNQGLEELNKGYLEEKEKEFEWLFAHGLSHTSISRVNKYLQHHWERYNGNEEEYFEFIEDTISQYAHKISYQQQNKATRWLQKMRNSNIRITETEKTSLPLNIPDTPKILNNKLMFTIDIKHFVYLMQALKSKHTIKGQTLETNNGAIMGFIIRHFCDKDGNPIKEEDLTPYFEKGTKPNTDIMIWNETNTKLANVFYELFMESLDEPFLKSRDMMKTLPKIISNSFRGKEKPILVKTIERCLCDDRRPPRSKRCPVRKHMKLEK